MTADDSNFVNKSVPLGMNFMKQNVLNVNYFPRKS